MAKKVKVWFNPEVLLILLHLEDHAFYLLALFEYFGGVADFLRPAHIGHVQQAVDPLFDLDERPIIGKITDATLKTCVGRIPLRHVLPRVFLGLLDAQGDLLFVLLDIQDNDVNHITDGKDLRWVVDTACPTHRARAFGS